MLYLDESAYRYISACTRCTAPTEYVLEPEGTGGFGDCSVVVRKFLQHLRIESGFDVQSVKLDISTRAVLEINCTSCDVARDDAVC